MKTIHTLRYAVAGFLLLLAVLAYWATGAKNRTYDGVLQHGFEKSDFYPRGRCSASPYWLEPQGDAATELSRHWVELGRPSALHVRFVGDKSHLGMWGHLGKYRRKIQPSKILQVEPSPLLCG
jgi:hypothetical protein